MIRQYTSIISGITTAYSGSGNLDKPVIVFVHGIGAAHRYWLPLAEQLQTEYRVIVPDLAGFGKTEHSDAVVSLREYANFLSEFVHQLEIKPVAYVGNSFGCQIIVDLLVSDENQTKAVLIGPTINRHERTLHKQLLRFFQDVLMEPTPSAPILRLLHDYWDAGFRAVWRSLRAAITDNIEQKIANLTQPILIIRGSRDAIAPQLWVEELAHAAQKAHIAVIPGAHVVHLTNPREVAHEIRHFLLKT